MRRAKAGSLPGDLIRNPLVRRLCQEPLSSRVMWGFHERNFWESRAVSRSRPPEVFVPNAPAHDIDDSCLSLFGSQVFKGVGRKALPTLMVIRAIRFLTEYPCA